MKHNPLLFRGRIRRLHYFVFLAAVSLLGVAVEKSEGDKVGLLTILSILMVWPAIALFVQRAHDSGRDGAFAFQAAALSGVGSVITTLSFTGDAGLRECWLACLRGPHGSPA